jgi:hypothetical protein
MVTNPSVPANTVLNRSRRPNGASNVNQFVALVIDTVGVRTDRPLAMIDMYGTPYSQSMHVVERYRLIDYDEVKAAMIRSNRENIKIGEMDSTEASTRSFSSRSRMKAFSRCPGPQRLLMLARTMNGRNTFVPKTLLNFIPMGGRPLYRLLPNQISEDWPVTTASGQLRTKQPLSSAADAM